MRGEEYARFSRIVFDTAPTGHTLRLLTVPDFVEAALGKLIRLRKKLTAAGDAVRGIFGVSNQDVAIQKLEALRVSHSDYQSFHYRQDCKLWNITCWHCLSCRSQ